MTRGVKTDDEEDDSDAALALPLAVIGDASVHALLQLMHYLCGAVV